MEGNSAHKPVRKMSLATRISLWVLGIIAFLIFTGYIAFQVSPWPAALLIRKMFAEEGAKISAALEKHVPPGISSKLNEHYDLLDKDAYLDVYYPTAIENLDSSLLTVVWVHGGGWVAGSKEEIGNYCKILAGKGFVVVSVEYSIAPGKTYPTPVRQVNAALAYLDKNAKRLHVDPSRLVLAGDSGGAHIVSQTANVIAEPSYARALGIIPSIPREQLRGMLLYCGPYDTKKINLEGPFGGFLKTVLWSYSGGKDFMDNPKFATASVVNYVTPAFPPTYISVGNADPLGPQSHALAETLTRQGVYVDSLFFPKDYAPPLPHEYQFNLDTDAGKLALERSVKFLSDSLLFAKNN